MAPVGMLKSKKGLQVLHSCVRCGVEKRNIVSTVAVQPDAIEALVKIPFLY
jgi:hypothetical protein